MILRGSAKRKNLALLGVSLDIFPKKQGLEGQGNRVFGKPCFCSVPNRGCFDENGENDEFAFYPLKTQASLFKHPKTTKIAGVTQAKAWFRKRLVCFSLRLFRFSRFLPICSDLRSLFLGIPRFVPICSVFFRFVLRTNQSKSGRPLSADPFCRFPTKPKGPKIENLKISLRD